MKTGKVVFPYWELMSKKKNFDHGEALSKTIYGIGNKRFTMQDEDLFEIGDKVMCVSSEFENMPKSQRIIKNKFYIVTEVRGEQLALRTRSILYHWSLFQRVKPADIIKKRLQKINKKNATKTSTTDS